MKVSSSTYLKLLAPLLASLLTMAEDVRPDGGLALAAEKEAKKATAEVLATCESGDEFLVSVFESTDDDVEYTETFQGCYMEAKNNDDDYELSIFTIEGNQTAGGPAFYASDNSGSLEEPIWYFTQLEEGIVSSSFYCYDLDEAAAADIHPTEVSSWGVVDGDATAPTRTCNITIACGCSEDDDSVDDVEDDADGDTDVEDTPSAASSVVVMGNTFIAIAESLVLAALLAARF